MQNQNEVICADDVAVRIADKVGMSADEVKCEFRRVLKKTRWTASDFLWAIGDISPKHSRRGDRGARRAAARAHIAAND